MAPKKKLKNKPDYIKKYFNKDFLLNLILNPEYITATCIVLFIFEIILNLYIIQRVKYTEIDWVAYMQEVEGFLNGTFDYSKLRGDTGPLVYPAGFVYIYSIFYYITDLGKDIYLAQHIFLAIFLTQTALYYRILILTSKVPPYALIIATLTSYRIHSIYVLRLFNDPVAVLLFFISLNLFLSNRWYFGSVFFSLAVSVKMNILLYAPCLLVAYLTNLGVTGTIKNLLICAGIQLFLGMPFLLTEPLNYIKGSFDIGRIFEHKWTVNYRFLPIDVFENRAFHLSLLVLHVVLLGVFFKNVSKYFRSYCKLNYVVTNVKKTAKGQNEAVDEIRKVGVDKFFHKVTQLFVLPFFVTNLIGMACARSLHYQFYSWYFFSMLYLVFCTKFKLPVRFLLLGVVEYCWNVYPSTGVSSALLHVCHVVILYGVYK